MSGRGLNTTLMIAAVLLSCVVWFGLWQPAKTWKEAQFSALSEAQKRAAALKLRLEELRREASALSTATRFEGVWTASSAGEATARIQAQLSDLARQNDITLRAITPLNSVSIPLKEAVTFRIEAEAHLDQLTTFLRAAEFASPVLVFEKGSLRRLTRPGPPSSQPLLFFQFDVLVAYDIEEERR